MRRTIYRANGLALKREKYTAVRAAMQQVARIIAFFRDLNTREMYPNRKLPMAAPV
jgi:hypothetical protein